MKKRPSSGEWPASHWLNLFGQATALLEQSCPGAAWTFGGGTALALGYEHRISYDVDIFLHDAQVLPYLAPRLNDIAASIALSHEESANGLKIVTHGGDIDFVVTADVTDIAPLATNIGETAALVQAPAEILAKKIQYRGYQFTHRDIFDLAMLLENDPAQVDAAVTACSKDAIAAAAEIIAVRLPTLSDELPDYINPTADFRSLIGRAPGVLVAFPRVRDFL